MTRDTRKPGKQMVIYFGSCLVAKLCLTLCNPMDCTHQAPPSMGFPRQEYWSGLPLPSPGDLPNPGIETTWPVSPVLWADSLSLEASKKSAPQTAHFN